MKKLIGIGAITALVLAACATDVAQKQASPEPKPSRTEARLTTTTATVEAVDLMNRTVTLRGSQGKMVTVNVSEAVKNLPQVEVGDQVKMDYYEAVAFQVIAPGSVESGAMGGQAMATAKPGQKPAGAVVNEVTVTTTLEAIDRINQTVTLKGPRGRTQTIRVRDPSNLDKVQIGDQVVITYTEALAISVEELGQ